MIGFHRLKVFKKKLKLKYFSNFQHYKAKVENQIEEKIQMLRNDHGKKYKSNEFNIFCPNHGIRHQFTKPHATQQNGVCERNNYMLIRAILTMFFHCLLPKSSIRVKQY
jgi:transposase InsO family protein